LGRDTSPQANPPRREHPRRLGKILRLEDAEHEIGDCTLCWPFLPQIRNDKTVLRRPPRRSTRSLPGSVEAQAYYRRTEHRGNPAKVISSARTRIGDPPASGCRCSAGLRYARGGRRRDGVEMTPPQERLAVF